METIFDAIDRCQAFVFFLSPNSLTSRVCVKEELGHAISAQKRIIPVMVHNFDDAKIPLENLESFESVKRLQYVFLRDSDPFEDGIAKLVEALKTDEDHLRRHTQYLLASRIWDSEKRPKSRLLRGEPLERAQSWLLGVGAKQPPASRLQIDFIEAARLDRDRLRQRKRITIAGVGAIGLALISGIILVLLVGQARLRKASDAAFYFSEAQQRAAAREFPEVQYLGSQASELMQDVRPTVWTRRGVLRQTTSIRNEKNLSLASAFAQGTDWGNTLTNRGLVLGGQLGIAGSYQRGVCAGQFVDRRGSG